MSKDADAESRNIDKLIRSFILKSYLNHNMISYEAFMFFHIKALKYLLFVSNQVTQYFFFSYRQ